MSSYFRNVVIDLSGGHTESARLTIVGGTPDAVLGLFNEPLKVWNAFGISGAFCDSPVSLFMQQLIWNPFRHKRPVLTSGKYVCKVVIRDA